MVALKGAQSWGEAAAPYTVCTTQRLHLLQLVKHRLCCSKLELEMSLTSLKDSIPVVPDKPSSPDGPLLPAIHSLPQSCRGNMETTQE